VTKKWSSTKSGDGQTKRAASKLKRRSADMALLRELKRLEKQKREAPPMTGKELDKWLNKR
jgi:hypothetical protein